MTGGRRLVASLALAWGTLVGTVVSAAPAGAFRPGRPAEPSATDAKKQAAPEPASAHELARFLGLEPAWLEPEEKLRLASRWTELVFNTDSREVLLNDIRVFMGEGATVVPDGKTLRLSGIDRDRLLVPILAPQTNEPRRPVQIIALDPGHGGIDKGTRNEKLGLVEKEFTLDVSRRLKSLLQARGFRVMLTRENDSYVPLPERPARAATAGADLFVSLHFNAAGRSNVRGIETYVLTPQFQRSTGSEEKQAEDSIASPGNRFDRWNSYLGYTIHGILLKELKLPDRGLKRARFAVLRDLSCPGLLVEGGYLSNPDEAKLVSTSAYRDRLAAAIANGIEVYNQTLKRLEASRAAESEEGS
ncbi:MAG: N-acetylmuramoyl-L-alanine amidase family protein [Opitutaceae bacterium]